MSLTPIHVLLAGNGRARRVAHDGWTYSARVGVAVAGLVALAAVGAGPAQAAFPGENGRLAFTAYEGERQDIFTIQPDGNDLRNLTNHPNTDINASYSSDGSQIAFASLRSGQSEIYTVAVNGTGLTRLTTSGDNIEPAFSPDGSRVVFTSFRDGNAEIYVINVDGTGETRLTNAPEVDTEPVFSPDGTKIAFHSFRDQRVPPAPSIYIMDADGDNQRRLTEPPADATTNAPGAGFPDFSPDGSKIVFTANYHQNNGEIYTMNLDGSALTRLTRNTAVDLDPKFSPDGTKIAFRSNRAESGLQQIYTMNAEDGSEIRQVTDTGSTKVLDDWGVRSDAPLDAPPPEPEAPPPPQPVPPPAPVPPPVQLPPPGPSLFEPQRQTEVDYFGGWAAWSAFEEGVGYRLVLRDPGGEIGVAPVDPRPVPFDVDLGPSEDGVVAAYSRCEQEPDEYGAGGVLLRTTGRGCDIFRLDVLGGGETKLEGASTTQASEYLPSVWRDRVAFARVYEQREGRRGQLPYLYVRPLEGGKSDRQPGGSRGDDGLPGPTGLDLYGRRMSLTWEWRDGDRLRSELRLDTVGGDHRLIDRLGSREAPANFLTPVGDRGKIFAGSRRLGGTTPDDRLVRFDISTNQYTQAPLQGPPLVGLGVHEGNFLLATADHPRQAPECGPGGCQISPLDIGD